MSPADRRASHEAEAAARRAAYVGRVVDAAPLLTDAQRARLRDLLSSPAGADR